MTDINDQIVEIDGHKITVGHYIKVLPTPGNKTSFIGRVTGWWIKEGEIVGVDVWGGRPLKEKMRSLRLDQIVILSVRKQNSLQRADEARRNGE